MLSCSHAGIHSHGPSYVHKTLENNTERWCVTSYHSCMMMMGPLNCELMLLKRLIITQNHQHFFFLDFISSKALLNTFSSSHILDYFNKGYTILWHLHFHSVWARHFNAPNHSEWTLMGVALISIKDPHEKYWISE